MTELTPRRRNRVYKALHKPLTYLGVERIQTDRRRLPLAPSEFTQQRLHILDQKLEASRRHPATHLLIHGLPGWQIVRHQTPLIAGLDHVTNPIEQRSKTVLTAPVVLPAQQKIRQHKPPLLIRHIRQVGTSNSLDHSSMLDRKTKPAKTLHRCKLHNRL